MKKVKRSLKIRRSSIFLFGNGSQKSITFCEIADPDIFSDILIFFYLYFVFDRKPITDNRKLF